jgi:hypothetical protein
MAPPIDPSGAQNDPSKPQQILQALAKMLSGTGQAVSGAAPGGGGTPGITPQVPQAAKPPVPQGSIAAGASPSIPGGPGASPGAQPVLPQAAHSQSPNYASGFSFPNPKARNAAVVTNMMESLGQFGENLAKHKYEKQTEEARGVVATMLRMGIAADNSQDPEAKKLLQQKANEMLGAKEASKILKDINKPGSAAYFGAQQAYKDIMAENEQKYKQQELQARMQAELARAGAEQERAKAEAARAAHEQKQTDLAGTVTPALSAQLQQRADAERLKSHTTLEAAQIQADTAIKTTRMRVDAIKNKNTGDDKILGSLAKEYSNLSTQFKNLGTDAGKLQKEIDDHPIASWWNSAEAKQKQNQIEGIKAQQDILQKQMSLVETKRETMMKFGTIPDITEAPAPASGSGGGSEPAGKGTEDDPIIVQ